MVLDFGLGLGRLPTMAIAIERPWEFIAKVFELWTWPCEASYCSWSKGLIPIIYYLFIAHFFGSSTKFGHQSYKLSTWTAIR